MNKVIQVDYYTDELVGSYGSVSDAARDNWLHPRALRYSLNHRQGVLPKKKLKFRYKEVSIS